MLSVRISSAAVGHEEAVAVEVGEHPLVRVEAVAVGQFQAVVEVAELGAEAGRAGQGRVDVQPEAVLAADAADLAAAGRWPSRRWCPPWRRRSTGARPAARSAAIASASRSGRMAKCSSTSIRRRLSLPRPAIAHALLDRRMGLRRGVGHQRAVGAGQVALAAGGPLAGGQDRAERGRRGAVLDHAAAGRGRLEVRAAGRACRPASRARGFPARCRRGWWPRASPARPARPRAARPGSTGRSCSQGK